MAAKRKPKQTAKRREDEARTRGYLANPEVQEYQRSYAEFLAHHPLVQAVMQHDEEKIEELLNELGI
jgi:hypothetical protein